MHKLFENVEKELKQIEQAGLNSNNLDTAHKLASIGKNIKKIEKLQREEEEHMREPQSENYGARRYMGEYEGYYPHNRGGNYNAYIEGSYGRREPMNYERGRYMDHGQDRFYTHLNKIEDGLDMYSYGKERYRGSGDDSRMQEGLERMMYGICMFIESALDFAETPEEKEIIRKHIAKLKDK